MNINKAIGLLLSCLILGGIQSSAINTNSAYISLFSQKTEIIIKNEVPTTRTKYEIVFKFNDEKAITMYHSYAIYYSFFDELEKMEVYTKNPQPNGKMKTIYTKDLKPNNSKSSSVFFDDQKEVNIDFLGLTVGSEAHVEYTVTCSETHFTDPMIFRYYLPIEKEIYELTVPDNVNISIIEKNVPPNFIQYTKDVKRNETIHTWLATNVDEEKRYDDAPAPTYFTPHIIYKIEDYTIKGNTKSISKSPRDLFEWYVSHMKHVNKITTERLKVMADSITKGDKTDQEKIKSVYNWVKTNIRYVAFENGMEGLVPREADAVCMKRYGDCKDMSSLQVGLLKALNIPAYYTWIGTRRIPYTYSELPMKNTDNHMIASVKDKDQWIFLDATDPNGIYGLPADHIQGKQAMIYINDTAYELAIVPIVPHKTNTIKDEYEMTMSNNDVRIHSNSKYAGIIAGSIANRLLYMSEKDKEEYAKNIIKGVSNNAILNKHTISPITDNANANIMVDFSIKDFIKEVDNEKYINLFLSKTFTNEAISDTGRHAPVSFRCNADDHETFTLTIPEDYKVTYIPENSSFKNDHFEYLIEYAQKPGKLILTQKTITNFPNLMLMPNEFQQWNQFIKGLNNAYKESVILEKIK